MGVPIEGTDRCQRIECPGRGRRGADIAADAPFVPRLHVPVAMGIIAGMRHALLAGAASLIAAATLATVSSADPDTTPSPADVGAAAATAHDAVVEPTQPLTVKLRPGATVATRRVRIKVWNGSTKGSAATAIRLVATSTDCPAGTIVGLPDFDGRTPGDQDTAEIAAGRSRAAKLTLAIDASRFTSSRRRVATRCTIELSAQVTAPDNVDPTPENDVAFMELNVIDLNDVDQPGAPEFWVESFRASHPGKIEIRAGHASQTKRVKAIVVHAGSGEATLALNVADGTCPPGTIGTPDFDTRSPDDQTSVLVGAGRQARATIPITVRGADFFSPTSRARARCIATLSVSSSTGDTDPSNNTTRMVVNVYDRNDM